MDGVIEGGWEYVIAAYAVVWGGMLAYGVTLWLRARSASAEGAVAPPTSLRHDGDDLAQQAPKGDIA